MRESALMSIPRRPATSADLRAFLMETAELRRQKVALVQTVTDCVQPGYVLYQDGTIERLDVEVPPAIWGLLTLLDEQIAKIAERYGVRTP